MKKLLLLAILGSSVAMAGEFKTYACGVSRVAFIHELNSAFEKKFKVKTTLNKKGGDLFVIAGVQKKDVEVGSGCREALDSLKAEKDVTSIQVAWGALAFIVNKDNKIDNITTQQIKDILQGRIRNWKELGGDDKPIDLIVRNSPLSGVGLSAREVIFNNRDEDFYSKAKQVKSSGFVREAVAQDKYAFAIDNTMSSSKAQGIKMLKVDGVAPTKENILSKKYKMRQAMYLYLPKNASDLAHSFVKFALSKEGQDIISKTGTANLEEATGKGDKENEVVQEILLDLQD